MSDSNLYEIALSNFKSAKILFKYGKDDDSQLNRVAYFLQQTLELVIKHILFMNGIEPSEFKTHNIARLIQIAQKENIDLFLTDYILERADIFTEWEEKTRYILGFAVLAKNIENSITEIENYILIVKNHFESK